MTLFTGRVGANHVAEAPEFGSRRRPSERHVEAVLPVTSTAVTSKRSATPPRAAAPTGRRWRAGDDLHPRREARPAPAERAREIEDRSQEDDGTPRLPLRRRRRSGRKKEQSRRARPPARRGTNGSSASPPAAAGGGSRAATPRGTVRQHRGNGGAGRSVERDQREPERDHDQKGGARRHASALWGRSDKRKLQVCPGRSGISANA